MLSLEIEMHFNFSIHALRVFVDILLLTWQHQRAIVKNAAST